MAMAYMLDMLFYAQHDDVSLWQPLGFTHHRMLRQADYQQRYAT